jgi:AAA15 family ATPase/GTPase
MLKSLEIKNFRCFESFRLEQLGQVNLLVGSNNSGKTSILEALHLFCYRDYLATLCQIMIDRGEYIHEQHETIDDLNLIELKHLFYNRKIHDFQPIDIIGKHDDGLTNKLNIAIKQDDPDRRTNNSLKPSRFELFITWFDAEDITEQLISNLSDGQRLIVLPYEYDYDRDENVLINRHKTEFVKSYSLTSKQDDEIIRSRGVNSRRRCDLRSTSDN